MADLRIADDMTLPVDLVVQQAAILARTGAGKTNAATVIAEELLAAGQQVVILDPPGAWWGLTASADGSKGGFPVVVFGGEHGDLPLPATGGALLADVVVDQGISAILDLSDLSNAQTSAFVLAFAARLYERKARARSPMLLVIEEADEVAPQRAMPDQTRMLGAIERVVKRGRMRGIGTLMISQRSASLNKNVLSQAELLIAMQTTAPQDIKAIDAWIEHHGDQEKRQQLISEIATLGKGEAFVWSPGWLHEFRKVRFRLRRTFDSSATPKPGEVLAEPTARADVDLAAIRARLEAAGTAERPEPKGSSRDQARALAEQRRLIEEQQDRIAALEAEVRELRARPAFDTERFTHDVAAMESAAMRVIDAAGEVRAEMARLRPSPPLRGASDSSTSAEVPKPDVPLPPPAPVGPRPRRQPAGATATAATLTAAQQRLLDTLASYEALGVLELDRRTLAVSSGVSPRSSAYDGNVRKLRAGGLVDYPSDGHVALTAPGRGAVAAVVRPPSLDELHDGWRRILTTAQGALLDILIDAYPASLSRQDLASRAGVSARSSSFDGNVRHLRSLGLAGYPADGEVAAGALLFPEGLR